MLPLIVVLDVERHIGLVRRRDRDVADGAREAEIGRDTLHHFLVLRLAGLAKPGAKRNLGIAAQGKFQGAQQVKRIFPQAMGVFILPPSLETLRTRLQQRAQDPPEVVERRLAAARSEMQHAPEFDFVIVNERFEQALAELAAVVTAARLRYASQAARLGDVFDRLGISRPGKMGS